jgi:hypothetical protein
MSSRRRESATAAAGSGATTTATAAAAGTAATTTAAAGVDLNLCKKGNYPQNQKNDCYAFHNRTWAESVFMDGLEAKEA